MESKDTEKQAADTRSYSGGVHSIEATFPRPRSSGSSTTQDLEELREKARRSNPNGSTRATGVSINQAEADFAHLRRELSGVSGTSHVSRAQSRGKNRDAARKTTSRGDVPSEEAIEQFDLETALRDGHEAKQASGIRPKHIGVYWNGLTVKGAGGTNNYVKTFPDAFVDFFDCVTPIRKLLGLGKKDVENTLLKNFKGICKPGEMVLVLGKPGSGCTTFLKNIANQRWGYTSVTGELLFGPFTANEFGEYRQEAVYCGEDDVHNPTLTVRQTLGFALDVKMPGKLPAGVTKAQFKEQVISLLLKMFNIEHTRDTMVGNHLVRGVSGGERKRVSIAEMLITNGCVFSWDNSTRGLDGSTALDFANSLRIQTNIYKTATFVSLYQASEKIYRTFDKVLVIDEGRQVFFGPTSEARAYFEGLGFLPRPRQTTADYITGCTDEFEREYQPGRSEANAPYSPDTLEAAFQESRFAKALDQEMMAYKKRLVEKTDVNENFRMAVHEAKRSGASKRSPYSAGFHQQIWALMKRQFVLKMQDRLALGLSWIRSIVIAIILGSLYLNLGKTSASAFSKSGLLFIALLYNVIQAFSELAVTMMGRAIVNKHRAMAFHRPSALWIAQILVDQAFSAPQILVFSLIVYLMTNLEHTPGAFFIFYLMILSGTVAMALLFRVIGVVSPDFDYAARFAVLAITSYILTCGYLIQYQSEKVWLRWIYFINVIGLTFSGMMENEFRHLDMTCTADSLIPSGHGYGNISHQVCTLPGSTPGTLQVSGREYVSQGFSYNVNDLWRNWCIVLALIVVFLLLNVILGEMIEFGMGGNMAKVFQKPNKELQKLNEQLLARRNSRRRARMESETSNLRVESESILTWEDVCYDVPVAGGTRRLLNNIYGYVRPGQLTALMGSSGAGKTTLLDVLAARKNVGVVSGQILVDGSVPGKEFQRSTSYAEQSDVHEPSQTVREALRFSADLRQPMETSRGEKYAFVEEIIALLEMETFADAIIGSPEAGLTVEERKRVTIGVELAAKPQLLLFLDEPTSGLDSQSAFNIVRFLKKLAAAGQAVLCTIHQPNAALFESFDRLLLLKAGGRCVYFGDIGEDACVLREYLKRHGAVAGETDNVAEFMLEAIGAGSAPRIGDRDWADIWEASPELATVKDVIPQMKAARRSAVDRVDDQLGREYASPFAHQLRVVCHRMNVAFWRSPNYLFTRIYSHVVIGIFTGLTFLNLDRSRSSLQYRVFVIFQITVLPALVLSQVELMYHINRVIFFREQSSKMYSSFTFAASMVMAELPYSFLCAVCFFLPIYYMPGFQTESSRAGYQFLMVLICELFSVTLGQCIAALTPSMFISSQFEPVITIIFALFCGVTIPAPQMPAFWRAWVYELVPFTRLIGGMVTTALHQLPVECAPAELNAFSAPPGQTCGEYMKAFFAGGASGYIVDNATSACQYCAYQTGDEFYSPLELSFDNRWRDLAIFLAFFGSNLVIMFLGSRFLNFNKR